MLHLEVIFGDPRSVIGGTLAANHLSSLLRDLHKYAETMARREGFEPPTLRSGSLSSSRLATCLDAMDSDLLVREYSLEFRQFLVR